MIIRPSPHKRATAAEAPAQWPPKSPFQALVSSPGGRQKWQQMQSSMRDRSPSPTSLRKHNISTVPLATDDGSDEDESALQLKLEILETKQRLRDIQRKQKKQEASHAYDQAPTPARSAGASRLRSPVRDQQLRETRPARIDVPVSPVKSFVERAEAALSPARARLGLHGPAKAENVSLKRRAQGSLEGSRQPKRPLSILPTETSARTPISSFSQRLAELKQSNTKKQAKSDRLEALRNSTFAARAQGVSSAPSRNEQASSNIDIYGQPVASVPRREYHHISLPGDLAPQSKPKKPNKNSKNREFYDPFSEMHLESRNISHDDLAQQLAGSEIYTIPRLLKEVVGPHYDTPDCEADYVVFAVIGEKSAPYKQRARQQIYDKDDKDEDAVSLKTPKAKFMCLNLCDLVKYDVQCYLFGSAFDKYWKLTEGTVIAILNPGVLPPKNHLTGKFSLKLSSSDDCILEIGKARDIGTCSAIRKDNRRCTSWVNKAKTTLCEFHLDLLVGKARKGRMEVNTMWRGEDQSKVDLKKGPRVNPNKHWDVEGGEYWSTGSTAGLLDQESDALYGFSKEEASRRRIAAAQRERDLASKLSTIRGGVAGEYFRTAYDIAADRTGDHEEVNFVKPTAAELGLLGKTASTQRLSPAKDRRRHFGIGAVSSAGTEAMGWGGARKADLLRPARNRLGSPEKGQTMLATKPALHTASRERSMSPSKQARFNLASGIKTPGRESGGHELRTSKSLPIMNDEDNDDDLDIV